MEGAEADVPRKESSNNSTQMAEGHCTRAAAVPARTAAGRVPTHKVNSDVIQPPPLTPPSQTSYPLSATWMRISASSSAEKGQGVRPETQHPSCWRGQ